MLSQFVVGSNGNLELIMLSYYLCAQDICSSVVVFYTHSTQSFVGNEMII